MPIELVETYLNLPLLGLVAARLGGLIMFQPLLSHLAVPAHLRAMFVVGLSVLVAPFVAVPAKMPEGAAGWAVGLAGEAAVGVVVGTLLMLLFAGVQQGTMLIAQESGLAFGQVVDPTTEAEQSVLGVLYTELFVLVYLVLGGHRAALTACIDSFATAPLLAARDGASAGWVAVLLDALAAGESMALRVAAPTVITLFLVNVALGLISRTMPQLNATTLGFTLKSLVSFALMAVSLPAALALFTEQLDEAAGWIAKVTGG